MNVYLRRLAMTDLTTILPWHNDPELYKHLLGQYPGPVEERACREWLARQVGNSSHSCSLAIDLGTPPRHIGNVYFRDIEAISRRAEFHIFIGEKNLRGQGIGSEVMTLALEYARDTLHLRRLYLLVLAENSAAIRIYEKVGFEKEGVLKGHVLKNRRYQDVWVMGRNERA
jgi:RimJ/RimL family protein N-acetyltransferase